MGKIILLVGPPNSGKTTWTKEFLKGKNDYVKISRDDFRIIFYDKWVVPNNIESAINEIQHCAIKNFLSLGYNIIIDNTNCKLKYIKDFVDTYGDQHDIIFKVFDVDKNTLMVRNHYRARIDGKHIPENVMENMINNFNKLKETFDFKDIIHQ